LTIGALLSGDKRVYNGRVACLKIYNTAFTDDEVQAFSENWECPHEPGKIGVVVMVSVGGGDSYDHGDDGGDDDGW
jgi:hypothetical protein